MLGGLKNFFELKSKIRKDHGLSVLTEDVNEVCRNMRPSSPPANANDLIDQQQLPRRSFKSPKKVV